MPLLLLFILPEIACFGRNLSNMTMMTLRGGAAATHRVSRSTQVLMIAASQFQTIP
jgi:hypothetical protein